MTIWIVALEPLGRDIPRVWAKGWPIGTASIPYLQGVKFPLLA